MAEDFSSTLHIAEGGFRPRPELLDAYIKRHEQFMPHAVAQAGFRETYGGPITGTSWWLFFAKFDTLEAMEDWQRDREHVKVQDEAREKWWAAYYIRKGRILADNETAAGIILNETMLLRDTPLSDTESAQVIGALSDIAALASCPMRHSGTNVSRPPMSLPRSPASFRNRLLCIMSCSALGAAPRIASAGSSQPGMRRSADSGPLSPPVIRLFPSGSHAWASTRTGCSVSGWPRKNCPSARSLVACQENRSAAQDRSLRQGNSPQTEWGRRVSG